jgi:hypothetical protein
MAAEVFEMAAELIFAVGEGAVESRSKTGCLVTIILILLLAGGVYWYCSYEETKPKQYLVKGIVTDKLSNNNVIIDSNGERSPYTLTKQLYDNKVIGDSIKILK